VANSSPRGKASPPKWVIDLHGIRDALTSKQNSIRVAVIEAIEAGQMHIIKPASTELKDLYPAAYATFQTIKNKKYVSISVAASATAAMLMETFGASPLGSIPVAARFEAVAQSRASGCVLVSSGKAHKECCAIAAKNGLPANAVVSIADFA
jgi:hypothetical protein